MRLCRPCSWRRSCCGGTRGGTAAARACCHWRAAPWTSSCASPNPLLQHATQPLGSMPALQPAVMSPARHKPSRSCLHIMTGRPSCALLHAHLSICLRGSIRDTSKQCEPCTICWCAGTTRRPSCSTTTSASGPPTQVCCKAGAALRCAQHPCAPLAARRHSLLFSHMHERFPRPP